MQQITFDLKNLFIRLSDALLYNRAVCIIQAYLKHDISVLRDAAALTYRTHTHIQTEYKYGEANGLKPFAIKSNANKWQVICII